MKIPKIPIKQMALRPGAIGSSQQAPNYGRVIQNSSLARTTQPSNSTPTPGYNTVQRPTVSAGASALSARPTNTQPAIVFPGQHYAFQNMADFVSSNLMERPKATVVGIASAAGAGAVNTQVLLFNQDLAAVFNITNNGSGAGTITYTYQDGAAGNLLSWLLAQDRAGMGAICFGMSLLYTVTATGAGAPTSIGTATPQWLSRTAFGNSVPSNFASTMNQTRADFNTAIEVYTCVQNVGRWTQFAFIIVPGNTVQATFYFTEDFKV